MKYTRLIPVFTGMAMLGGVILAQPTDAIAFWPFDLFKNDEVVGAQESQPEFPPIVEALITKFGLNREEVKQVVVSEREAHQQQMDDKLTERLARAVADGKITEDQKNALLAKHEEMQSKRDELKDLSPKERREKMQAWHEEMKKWADEQGVDMPQMGFRMGHQMGNW